MEVKYIVVQAGGKGNRLEYLTKNKPKCLVPINNLPMIFHLFNKFPNARFVIIGDYKYDVLREYLRIFAKIKYILVDARGSSGTCGGIKKALEYIPAKEAFMLIWSDLILSNEYSMPDENYNYIGISMDFVCRWKYENDEFAEEASKEHGVAGHFIFQNKEKLIDVPPNGEFVKWLQAKKYIFKELPLYRTKEYGLLSEYNKLKVEKCRPFNRLEIIDNEKILKEGIDEQGKRLGIQEKEWYKFVEKLEYKNIPKVYSYEPFIMEKINGKNLYEYKELAIDKKRIILKEVVNNLKELHKLSSREADLFSMKEAYINKTFKRLNEIRDLVPFANNKYIKINGRKCRNVFYFEKELEEKLMNLKATSFSIIHGDCTFSNMLLKEEKIPVLIDPRGYFGYSQIYGDVAYDWAKLYYSIEGNYDSFNLKQFTLEILEDQINLKIESNGWEQLKDEFFHMIKDEVLPEEIKLLHSVIWLSLTTYAWENYDSICGAFYNGLYYLEEVL